VLRILTATLIPLLLIGILEAGLRLAGHGHPTSLFIPVTADGAHTGNPRFGWRFFPRSLSRAPVMTYLPARKTPDTCRIFILGGSAAQGIPDRAYGFSRILGVMLRERYPGVRFEIVNTAMTAINSHAVLPIGRECLQYEPDLFIIFMGNNEVVGPFGGSSRLKGGPSGLRAIRLGLWAKTTRIGQLLGALVQRTGRRGHAADWRGMEMFRQDEVAAGAPSLDRVYDNFRANLDDLLDALAGSPTLACTVPVNLKDSPPFASTHREDLDDRGLQTWENHVARALEHAEAGAWQQAVEAFQLAADIDDRHAELHFHLGRCLFALGTLDRAREHFVLARDLDLLRFRADTGINAIIREAATAPRRDTVKLADLARAFADPDTEHRGLPGAAYFYEHAHLTFEGNYAAAAAMLKQVEALLPDDVRVHQAGTAVPDVAACARRLALTPPDRQVMASRIWQMTARPPFTSQYGYHVRREQFYREMRAQRADAADIAPDKLVRLYRDALEDVPDDLVLRSNFAHVLHNGGDLAGAEEQWRFVLERLPSYADAHVDIAAVLLAARKPDAAQGHLQRAMALAHAPAEYHNRIGELLARFGHLDQAIGHFSTGLQLEPNHAQLHVNLGAMYFRQQQLDAAIDEFRKAVELYPDDPVALNNLGVALVTHGDLDEARDCLAEAVRLDPFNIMARDRLAVALARKGDHAGAAAQLAAAIELEPDNPGLRKRHAEVSRRLTEAGAQRPHQHSGGGHR